MRCPTLKELPPPPPGKIGWPWTEESPPLPDTMPDGRPWPRVSIVTPSYNQGQFIEETIRSVLLQGYPDLEYIIIDGGSTDGSVDIIRKYEPWLAYWVSEPDKGQADAINKGWRKATGEFLSWLNSDDILLPNALVQAVSHLVANRDSLLVYCDQRVIDENSNTLFEIHLPDFELRDVIRSWLNPVNQPGFLMRSEVLKCVGFLDENLSFSMDFDYWLRISLHCKTGKIDHVRQIWSCFRRHSQSKSSLLKQAEVEDHFRILEKIFKYEDLPVDLRVFYPYVEKKVNLKAAFYFYKIGDAARTRLYALKALRGPVDPSSVNALKLFVLGTLGNWLMNRLRKWYRCVRPVRISYKSVYQIRYK
jgi:glycosyltransferase involved in cell wall biosynthesis